MPSGTTWAPALRDLIATDLMSRINTAAGLGSKLLLMSGTRPASGVSTPTPMCVLVASATASQFFIQSRSSGILTLRAIVAVAATGGGGAPGTDCTWIRHVTSAYSVPADQDDVGIFIADRDVYQTGSAPANVTDYFNMDNIKVIAGSLMQPGTMTITVPG